MSTAVRELVEAARDDRPFSGAAWAAGDQSGLIEQGVIGTRAWPELAGDGVDSGPVTDRDLFDLASVTKPLVGLVIMALVERGDLSLDDQVEQFLPGLVDAKDPVLLLRDLLLHTSGLPGQVRLYRDSATPAELYAAIGRLPRESAPGTRVTYSSQGFILLGRIAEIATGTGLSSLVTELVAKPAGAATLCYRPSDTHPEMPCVATELCGWRGRLIQGEVHDENAVVLGGVAGHAGLFGRLDDLAAVGHALVTNLTDRVLLSPTTLQTMITTRTAPLGVARSYAWQTAELPGTPAGDLLGPRSFGHTGFTGTSLFVDPDTSRWYVLLTNGYTPPAAPTGSPVSAAASTTSPPPSPDPRSRPGWFRPGIEYAVRASERTRPAIETQCPEQKVSTAAGLTARWPDQRAAPRHHSGTAGRPCPDVDLGPDASHP